MEILLVPSECQLHWHFRSRLWVVLSASKKETFRTANTLTLQWRNKQTNWLNFPKYSCWLFWLKLTNQTWYIISQLNGNSCHVNSGRQNDKAALRTCSLLSPLWERTPQGPTTSSTCRCGDPTTLLLQRSQWPWSPKKPWHLAELCGPLKPGRVRGATARQTWTTGRKRAAELENPARETGFRRMKIV